MPARSSVVWAIASHPACGVNRVNIAFWSATKLVRAIRAKKFSAVELLDLFAARIERYDKTLNSLCVLDLDAARKRARAMDRGSHRSGATTQPLAGLPMTV